MKKTLATICALMTLSMSAQADYTWIGGESITADGWKIKDNWELTNSTWVMGQNKDPETQAPVGDPYEIGSGPGTPSSEKWDKIVISDASGTIGTLEGWKLNLDLNNVNLTVTQLYKLQGGSTIDIDSNSTLTINKLSGGNDGNNVTINNLGTLNITLNKDTNKDSSQPLYNIDLGTTGIVNLSTSGSTTYTLSYNSISATLDTTNFNTTGDTFTILSRDLITLDGSAAVASKNDTPTFNITMNGFTQVMNEDDLTAGTYFIDTANGVSIKYGVAVPEPATATLSLLALAGLAARRRRR